MAVSRQPPGLTELCGNKAWTRMSNQASGGARIQNVTVPTIESDDRGRVNTGRVSGTTALLVTSHGQPRVKVA